MKIRRAVRRFQKNSAAASTALVSTLALVIAMPAQARAQKAEGDTSSEIIVTAQKRTERLQTTPVSVQPITGAALENRNLRNLEDYARFIPSLGISGFDFSGGRTIVLRGIAPSGGTEPTVITYLDDVIIPNTVDPQLYDIARVEVLKGPQGDLYGASSAGGLIRYVSNEPDYRQLRAKAEISGSATAGGDPNYGGAAAFNIPLSPFAAVRASTVYDRRGGFVDGYNPRTGQTDRDINGERRVTSRATLGLRPSSAFTANFSLLYNDRRVAGRSESDVSPFLAQGSAGAHAVSRFMSEPLSDRAWVGNATFNYDTGIGSIVSSTGYVSEKLRTSNDITSLFFLNPDLFGGYSYPGFDPAVDGPFATNPNTALLTPSVQQQTTRRLTQELRFASNWNFPIQALIGGFYLRDRVHEASQNGWTAPIPAYAVGVYGGAPDSLIEVGERTRSTTRELAVFGNLSWKFASGRGELKIGARHYDRRSATDRVNVPGALYDTATSGVVASKGELYSGTGSFQVSRGLFVYARYSEGFRPGETRPTLPPLCDGDLAGLGISHGALEPFTDPERIRNIEGGVRFMSSDRKISASLVGFHILYDGIQQSITLPVCGSSLSVNSGSATSNGFEFSAGVTPLPGLSFNLDAGFTDARFDTANADTGIDRGERLQYVPKWTVAIRGDYRFPLTSKVDGILRGDLTFTDTRQTTFGGVGTRPDAATEMPAFTLVGLQAGIARGRWELIATATNIFNVTPIYGNFIQRYATLSPTDRTFSIGRPRTIGLRLSVDY